MATGAMTIANDALSTNQPLSTVADKINWKVIPATAVAAGLFYGFEQINEQMAKALAALVFFTAFVGGESYLRLGEQKLSPLGTLLKAFNMPLSVSGSNPGSSQNIYGYPYTTTP